MIWNLVDNRERPYRWKKVKAIIETTWHDNSCKDADEAPRPDDDEYVLYDERAGVSVHDAIVWAESQIGPVTLYLYDMA